MKELRRGKFLSTNSCISSEIDLNGTYNLIEIDQPFICGYVEGNNVYMCPDHYNRALGVIAETEDKGTYNRWLEAYQNWLTTWKKVGL